MDIIINIFNITLNYLSSIEIYINTLIFNHGTMTYFMLFLIIFLETAILIAFFLPGDSLLLATGALVAGRTLDLYLVLLILTIAAILGNICNYGIGFLISKKLFNLDDHERKFKLINRHHYEYAHDFFNKYGGVTIVISRFVPFLRVVAPFIAGLGKMSFYRFLIYNFVGGIAWVISLVLIGMLFGKIPFFHENILFLIIIILFFTFLLLPLLAKLFSLMKQ